MSDLITNSSDKWMDMEVAVMAGTYIPAQMSTLPFASNISLRRVMNTKAVNYYIWAFVSHMGILCVDNHLDWIRFIRIAGNCFEQNLIANLSHNNSAIVLNTVRPIRKGEELKVWLSDELMLTMNIAFLRPNNIINNQCYRCHRCGQSFCQPNPLKVHLSYECKQINQNLFSHPDHQNPCESNRLSIDSETIVQSVGEQPSHTSHTCLYCGKIYSRKYGLKIHVRTHTGQKPLLCKFCGRPFSDPSNLNKHIRLHAQQSGHQSSPYKCKHCAKVLIRRRDLERHVKSRHQSI